MKNNNLDLDPKKLLVNLNKYAERLQRYVLVISFVVVFGLYGFLVIQISTATQQEPSQEDITLQLSTIKRLKIDQESIDKIEQLQDQNIVVQSLFESARQDPFKE